MTDSELDDTQCDIVTVFQRKPEYMKLSVPGLFHLCSFKVFVNILSTLICCTLHIKYHIFSLRKVIN